MNIPHSYHLSTGGSVDAVHDNGSGESTTTLGTLLDLDDAGYVVIKIKDGKLVYIPKGRVIKITQLSD